MSALPRLLAIMGSGETAPTMTAAHRALFARVGGGAGPAVLLDTPFGFQRNAQELTDRAVQYFAESVGQPMAVASFRRASTADALAVERLRLQLRDARLVFAGPGSPSYALRQWVGSPVPTELAAKLTAGGGGGCVTFASAAALTLGIATVPVYEIYKVGDDPQWMPGLDLMAVCGLRVAVIPHYDNSEGRSHDTRFCYLGEERLSAMEAGLPLDAFVLGVDEHTAAVVDLDAASVSVTGRGGLTVRARGRSQVIGSGTATPLAQLAEMAEDLRKGAPELAGRRDRRGPAGDGAGDGGAGGRGPTDQPGAADGVALAEDAAQSTTSPLLESVAGLEAEFAQALELPDPARALRCILDLEDALHAWSADSLQSDEADRGRGALRAMIVRFGEAAEGGFCSPRVAAAPWVDALMALRNAARADQRWADADIVRNRLVSLGVEIHDGPDGSSWDLTLRIP